MKNLVAALVVALALAPAARAQDTSPILELSRGSVNVTAGAMFLTNGADWSGASVGAVAGYNLHPKLSVAVGYDHGAPINSLDKDLNIVRAWASLPVVSNVYAGFGYVKFDSETKGGFAQLVLYRPVMRRLDLSFVYAHVFPEGEVQDFEQARAVVSYHLLGKE